MQTLLRYLQDKLVLARIEARDYRRGAEDAEKAAQEIQDPVKSQQFAEAAEVLRALQTEAEADIALLEGRIAEVQQDIQR